MILAYSPQARGRGDGVSATSGPVGARLPQELRLQGITTLEAANAFLPAHYIAEFNRRFQWGSGAVRPGSAFVPRHSRNLAKGLCRRSEEVKKGHNGRAECGGTVAGGSRGEGDEDLLDRCAESVRSVKT